MLYNRDKAVNYANEWAYRRNPAFYDYSYIGGDCTNFASQVLYAGSGIMNYTPTFGWYYLSTNNRTPSWTGVNQLYNFLVNNTGAGPQGKVVPVNEIMRGDILQLSFDGIDFAHTPVIVDTGDFTPETILVAAHTNDSNCRPLNTYSYQAVRFIHIYNVGR